MRHFSALILEDILLAEQKERLQNVELNSNKIISLKDKTHYNLCFYIHTVKLRVLTRVYNMEINFFPKGHSK